VGHVRNYIISDIILMKRMRSFNVRKTVRLGRLRAAGGEHCDQDRNASRDVDARQHRAQKGVAAARHATPGSARLDLPARLLLFNQWIFLKMLERGLAAASAQR
jgi:hypothetical protein